MPSDTPNRSGRKPHLLRAKLRIVELLDFHIEEKMEELQEAYSDDEARDLAIFIRQRNKIARDAGVKEIPLSERDGQGRYTIGVNNEGT